jgi:gliding motility-associated peptidyl-prolyl isomerase
MNKFYLLSLILFAFISCKSPEARHPVSVKSGSFIDASVERNKKMNSKEHAHIKKLIQQEKNLKYIASPNGFWYAYKTKLEADSLKTPKFGDVVTYNYNIKALNGTEIYTTENLKPQTYTIDKEELFSGLREGLKLMKAGETVTFLFPSQKAYGYYGDGNKIGRNTPLICDVTLYSITENEHN